MPKPRPKKTGPGSTAKPGTGKPSSTARPTGPALSAKSAAEPEPAEPQGIRRIKQLVRLMARYNLTAIDVADEESTIRLRRHVPGAGASAPASAPGPYLPPPGAVMSPLIASAPAAPPTAEPGTTVSPAPKGVFIESPMVGTFYSASSPETPPFANVGTRVRKDTVVCIIEAMKVFTDIPAGLDGTIAEVLVKNGQPVEFGQPLFRVDPS